MGYTGFEFEMPLGMLFRKMYCHKCGMRMETRKATRICSKGEPGYSSHVAGNPMIGMTQVQKTTYFYQCPQCNNSTEYDQQKHIAKIQKKLKKKVLTNEELN